MGFLEDGCHISEIVLGNNNTLVKDKNKIAATFNNYFSSISGDTSDKNVVSSALNGLQLRSSKSINFIFSLVSCKYIATMVTSLKKKQSSGWGRNSCINTQGN